MSCSLYIRNRWHFCFKNREQLSPIFRTATRPSIKHTWLPPVLHVFLYGSNNSSFTFRSTFINWWKVILILVLYDPVPTRSCYRPRKRYWSILPLSCHCAKRWLCLQQYSVFSPLCQCNWISGRWPAWRVWRVTYIQEFNIHICVYILHAGMFQ